MSRVFRRLKALLRWEEHERDLRDEISAHLALDTQERIAAGEPPDVARRAALRDFGNVTRAAEDTRAAWGWTGVEQFAQDLRIAIRVGVRNPGFTTAAILTLAISIGASTAIFGVAYYTLIAPLPFQEPNRLVRLFEFRRLPLSAPTYLDWRAHNRSFERIAAFRQTPRTIETPEGVEQIGGMEVSADFFAVLGTPALYGRIFIPNDDRPGAERVVIVSDQFWRTRLQGNGAAIGQDITLNNERFIVVGVLPDDFRFTASQVDVWTPLRLDENPHRMNPDERFLHAVARLRDGITPGQADADVDALAARVIAEQGSTTSSRGADVVPLRDELVGNLRGAMLVLVGASALVLLIGCFNLTNLFLARSIAREREIGVRFALGASRYRILRQLMAESGAIAVCAGAAAILVYVWGTQAALPLFTRLGGSYAFVASRMTAVAVDWRVAVFAMTLCLVASVFCAVLSVGRTTGPGSARIALQPWRGTASTKSRARFRSALVVAEIAFTLVLLTGAGLLLNSLWRVRQVDLGFDPSRILTMRLHSTPPNAIDFYHTVLERARALPGIESASTVSSLPLLGVDLMTSFEIEKRPPAPGRNSPRATYKVVGDKYFETMRMRLSEGRYFDDQDVENREPVVIINRAMAREHWPGESPIGRRIQRGGPRRPWSTVVGVVEDVKVSGPEAETPPEIYVPHPQFLLLPNSRLAMPNMTLVVRTASEPARYVSSLRAQIRALDKNALITNTEEMEEALSRVIAPRQLNASVVSAFAAVALGLAIIGVYGVMSYTVSHRSQEIGIRMALGARRLELLLLILRQAVRLASLGIIIGIAGALALTRWMSAMLFEVQPTDPATLAAVIVIVLMVSLIASYVPARRAATMDPLIALRAE